MNKNKITPVSVTLQEQFQDFPDMYEFLKLLSGSCHTFKDDSDHNDSIRITSDEDDGYYFLVEKVDNYTKVTKISS